MGMGTTLQSAPTAIPAVCKTAVGQTCPGRHADFAGRRIDPVALVAVRSAAGEVCAWQCPVCHRWWPVNRETGAVRGLPKSCLPGAVRRGRLDWGMIDAQVEATLARLGSAETADIATAAELRHRVVLVALHRLASQDRVRPVKRDGWCRPWLWCCARLEVGGVPPTTPQGLADGGFGRRREVRGVLPTTPSAAVSRQPVGAALLRAAEPRR